MRDDQIQASVPAPVASLPPREPMPTVHFSMARSVHFSMAIDTPEDIGLGGVQSGRQPVKAVLLGRAQVHLDGLGNAAGGSGFMMISHES